MDKNKIRLDYNNMMADVIGERGFTKADFDAVKDRVDFAVNYFNEKQGTGFMGWTRLHYEQDQVVEDIVKTAEKCAINLKILLFLVLVALHLVQFQFSKLFAICTTTK